jgi:cation transport protein ChaC
MQLDEFMARLPKGDFWVFGYGSLMWSPCFSYQARVPGRAHGYHRALCILSTRYRGHAAPPRTGDGPLPRRLVLGRCVPDRTQQAAPRAGAAVGAGDAAPRLPPASRRGAPAQRPHGARARLRRRPDAFAYVDELDLHGRARLVAQGIGVRGPCVDYIQNTLDHMHEVGVRDPHLERVLHAAQELRRGNSGTHPRKGLAQARALRTKVQPHEARVAKLRSRDNATPCSRKSAQGSALFSPEQSIQAR